MKKIELYRKEEIFNELAVLCDNYNDEELEFMIEELQWLLKERKRQQKELDKEVE